MMKKYRALALSVLSAALLLTGCGAPKTDAPAADAPAADVPVADAPAAAPAAAPADAELHHVEIDLENYGTIAVELNATAAPLSVANFTKLAGEGFYDGLTFHRIIDGFMMQGGDPEGTGAGGASETVKGEFASNGVDNTLSHTRGAISMARSQDMDSASSQFFIVHQDSTFLDGDYAAFGYVTSGMDIVDKICTEAAVTDGNGSVAPENQPIIKTIRVLD